jgi:hypothetical protein
MLTDNDIRTVPMLPHLWRNVKWILPRWGYFCHFNYFRVGRRQNVVISDHSDLELFSFRH